MTAALTRSVVSSTGCCVGKSFWARGLRFLDGVTS